MINEAFWGRCPFVQLRCLGCIYSLPLLSLLVVPASCIIVETMITTSSIDVGASHPIVSFEHVNINSGGRWDESFETFYFKALGFVNDPRAQQMSSKGLKWINMGHQQIHLPASDPAQKVRGHIGLEYSNLAEVQARLLAENIPHRVIRSANNETEYIETVCPVGNVFRLHQQNNPSPQNTTTTNFSWLGPLPHITPSEEIALPGGLAAGLGMRYVDFWIPRGSAGKIAAFYGLIFGSNATMSTSAETGTAVCVISVGCRQSIRYTEVALPITTDITSSSATDLASQNTDTNTSNTLTTHTAHPTVPTTVPTYDYHHIAIYVNDFVGIYTRLKEAGLVYENPRFAFRYGTIEQVLACNEFRLLDIVDLDTKEMLYQLEHEIRSLHHPAFSCPWLLNKS